LRDPRRILFFRGGKNIMPKPIPNREEVLREVMDAVEEGRLSLAEASGFSMEEMEGAYACGCRLVEAGRFEEALHVSCLLLLLDLCEGRHYLLAGTALRGLHRFEEAERAYAYAAALEPGSARARIYQGEMKIRLGDVDEGIHCLDRGAALAGADPEDVSLAEHARSLMKRFHRS
jgi:tetratricopeptide (TPR) repeat protein